MDSLLPLWLVIARRYLVAHQRPVFVRERYQLKQIYAFLVEMRAKTPEPTNWLGRLLYPKVVDYLEREIAALAHILDLGIIAAGLLD